MPRLISSRLELSFDADVRLRPDQVAKLLDVDLRTVTNRMNEGKIRYEIVRGHPLIHWPDYLRFLFAGATIKNENDIAETIVPENGLVDLLRPEDIAERLQRSRHTAMRSIFYKIRGFDITQGGEGSRPTYRAFEGDVPPSQTRNVKVRKSRPPRKNDSSGDVRV